jgi:nicotinamidase-related amidase
MPSRNLDLHGSVPDSSGVALLLIDVINDMEFDEGDALVAHALPAAHRIAALKKKAKTKKIPAIYINDNFGKWQSDFRKLVAHCLEDGVRGEEIVRLLQPEEDDYFVLKPKHSAFYSTTLDTLLDYLGARVLIMTGFAGNICILFSANDGYMRDFHLYVPKDCVASNSEADNVYALTQMERVLKSDITSSDELDLDELLRKSAEERGPR